MPKYLYRCSDCEVTFEIEAAWNEATVYHPCPECGKPAKRDYSKTSPYIHYKGDGWTGAQKEDR